MFRTFTTVVVCLGFLLVADYASSTKMKSVWKNPTATASSLEFQKVLVMVTIPQELTRKVAEDRAVQILESGGRVHAVASYTFIAEDEMKDKELVKSKITDMGFDGVIVMKYAGSKDEYKYDEDAGNEVWLFYNDWYGFYGSGLGAVYNATSTNDLTVYIETMFYSLKESKLIWSGITSTKNPKNPAKVVTEIAEETSKSLQEEGLIAKKKK